MRKIKQSFNFIFALVVMLTMAQTAWAGKTTETRAVTFYMDGGVSGKTNLQGDSRHVLVCGGMTLEYKNNNTATNTIYMNPNNNQVVFRLNIISCGGFLEFTNLQGKNDNSTLLHVEGNANDYDFPSIDSQEPGNATFEGSLAVSPSSPLRICFPAVTVRQVAISVLETALLSLPTKLRWKIPLTLDTHSPSVSMTDMTQ